MVKVFLDLRHEGVRWGPSFEVQSRSAIELHSKVFELELQSRSDEQKLLDVDTPVYLAAGFLEYLSRNDSAGNLTQALFNAFEEEFLANDNIHIVSSSLPNASSQSTFLANYYAAFCAAGSGSRQRGSRLLSRARAGHETLFGVFGGQGASNLTCLKELKDLYTVYGGFLDELFANATEVLDHQAKQEHTSAFFEHSGFNVTRWVAEPTQSPTEDQVWRTPFSVPLIGLLSLAHFCVTCKVLGQTPGEVRDAFEGFTGHSQGIVIAAIIARSTSWSSFYESARMAMRILFCIGYECHQTSSSLSSVPAHIAEECVEAGEGTPSPMLSVRGLDQKSVERVLDKANSYIGDGEHMRIALINSTKSFVVAGHPRSLCALSTRLRNLKASDGLDQSKIVFNRRKPVIRHQFLPMSSAFHSSISSAASMSILKQLESTSIRGDELGISVYHTCTKKDLSTLGDQNIVPDLVAMIITDLVDWPLVAKFPDHSTLVDFGPGGTSRITEGQIDGLGIRQIDASALSPSSSIGSKADLFTMRELINPPHWKEMFQPRVVKSLSGAAAIETQMTRLFGYSPIMVAGMTPTTVPYDFVAKIMQAGYHAELACGGYNSQDVLESAIIKLSEQIPPTAGITCNIIYASPKAVGWQIPLIRDLIRRGYPISGLTVGAGVPSEDVADEYITTMGLKHISFKPGSADSINQVIKIAKRHPSFPVGLQWTGGRGGGHHSYEDFHAAMLDTYSKIRQCQNIVLIAGSGFGGSDDTYPYLSGQWSQSKGRPAMPFDGVLLASRVMASKESHLSPKAKALIIEAPGVADDGWHQTYTRPTGGILTVKSEMGQPIHKLATRGVVLWSELDQKFFSIADRARRLSELRKNKTWIIERLNNDFQKVWFAMNRNNEVLDVEDMTYAEVLQRLVDLMYVQHQQRWIDVSYKAFVADFYNRARERLQNIAADTNSGGLQHNPNHELARFLESYPEAQSKVLHPEDVEYFLGLCRQRGRKPVNFIPALDEDFETWFKKDSLWQAEDVDSLPDQDAQRACIIHGPVAASFSVEQDEPVKNILDSIHEAWIMEVQKTQASLSSDGAATLQDGKTAEESSSKISSLLVENTPERKRYRFPTVGDLPDTMTFQEHLTASLSGWALDCVREETVRQDQRNRPNPLRSVLVPLRGHDLSVEYATNGTITALTMDRRNTIDPDSTEVIRIFQNDAEGLISATLFAPGREASSQVPMRFHFKRHEHGTHFSLEEKTSGRNQEIKDFYAKLWLPQSVGSLQDPYGRFTGENTTLTPAMVQSFAQAAGSTSFSDSALNVPIDISIVVAWEALIKPLLSADIDCDILRLLHLSNEFRYVEGAGPLKIGDMLTSSSELQAVSIHHGNKIVEVLAEIRRGGKPVVHVLSKFFCKGSFTDFETTMRHVREPQYEVLAKSEVECALLASREWLVFEHEVVPGQVLDFDFKSSTSYESVSNCEHLTVIGNIILQTVEGPQPIGRVDFDGLVHTGSNPVTDFLNRHGRQKHRITDLDNPGLEGKATWSLQALSSNMAYARASKDINPIHTLPTFARFAQLDGVVNHGMGTSAIVLRSLERELAAGEFSRIKRYLVSFEGPVLPGDQLKVDVQHIGMRDGLKVFNVKASNSLTGEKVLEGEAEIAQPTTAYIFTGQGSQQKGMGMKLYESSEAARGLWDRADRNLYELYGFSILDIVRNDPKSITIHFKGAKGRKIRDNYLALAIDRTLESGEVVSEPLIKDLTPTAQSYTFVDQRGLLYSTSFAQPAITLMEMAAAVDLKSKGLVQEGASYAGHSLGEYSALGAVAHVMPMESMVNLVFYRGLAMQNAMERDADGRTDFSMMAVNPSRVAPKFGQSFVEQLVGMITAEMGILLEIVNFNVEGRQYVCAGHLRALWALGQILDNLAAAKPAKVPTSTELLQLVKTKAEEAMDVAEPVELERGTATVPLRGIDVPFHSRYLRHGIPAFRKHLETQILEDNIDLDRLATFVPNVMGKQFSTEKAYVEEAAEVMNSDSLREILTNWSE